MNKIKVEHSFRNIKGGNAVRKYVIYILIAILIIVGITTYVLTRSNQTAVGMQKIKLNEVTRSVF